MKSCRHLFSKSTTSESRINRKHVTWNVVITGWHNINDVIYPTESTLKSVIQHEMRKLGLTQTHNML